MTEKTGFKYRISFSQSITTGIIGFSGDYFFDTLEAFDGIVLKNLIEIQEQAFRDAGYKVASDITPKEKEVKKT